MRIYTIGHSVHTKDRMIDMLTYAGIDILVDVRRFPASRKHPQFAKEKMEKWLPEAGINYRHFLSLAGRRNKSCAVQDELNNGWRNDSFHHYADFTLTDTFQQGIKQLENLATDQTVAYCCSERHPSRCHRLLISNWLAANGWEVRHMIDGNNEETQLMPHVLGEWGAVPIIEKDGTVVYPAL